MNKRYILLIIALVTLTFFTYLVFFNNKDEKSDNLRNLSDIIQLDSRTKYENPLNGEITLSNQEPEFLRNKPLGVMLNNAVPARPQTGISKSDIVYEIVAEGGITRYLAFFLSDLPEKVGPIRSVREYYLIIVKELGDSLLMHIGYSPQALQKINEWDILSLGLNGTSFYRDNRGDSSVATEHTAFASAKDLYSFANEKNFIKTSTFQTWKFNENFDISNLNKANYIQIDFWYEGDYSGIFKYDINTNEYIRYTGIKNGVPELLIDDLTNKEVRLKNVLVQFAEETPVVGDDKGRLEYQLIGSGNAILFRDGAVIKANWKKDSLSSRTLFYDLSGRELEFNRGKIWVSIVPSRNENQVNFKE